MADNVGSFGFISQNESDDFLSSMTVFGNGFSNALITGTTIENLNGSVTPNFGRFIGVQTESVSGNG